MKNSKMTNIVFCSLLVIELITIVLVAVLATTVIGRVFGILAIGAISILGIVIMLQDAFWREKVRELENRKSKKE